MPQIGERTDQGYLNRLHADRLPVEVMQDIFSKAKDQSVLFSMGRRVPVSINQNVWWSDDTYPEAGQVGGTSLVSREGAEKPLAGMQYGTKRSFSPAKFAVITSVSEEYIHADVDRLYTNLAPNLAQALSRAADLAAFHNRNALTGGSLTGTTDNGYINQTTNRVTLDFASSAEPDLVDQLLAGCGLVIEDEAKNFDVTGFAAAPSTRFKFVGARDKDGNQIFTQNFPNSGAGINVNGAVGGLLGVPVQFGRAVKGKIGAYAGTNVQMFGGDWSQLAYGFADDISIRVSTEAMVGGVSMFETNQVAILAECTFGWVVADTDAFVAFDAPVVES